MTDINEILKFHTPAYPGRLTLDQFHEWNAAFALDKFKAKRLNNAPVTFFNFHTRAGATRILETRYRNEEDKYMVFGLVRLICAEPRLAVVMVSSITEAWIATMTGEELKTARAAGLEVRDMPGREDCLMASTFHRDGSARCARWVVKLKPDPTKNIVLARDDIDMSDGRTTGEAVYFFTPARSTNVEDDG